MSKSEIQAEFFNQALGLSREKFQSWLTPICAMLHEGADCVEVMPTQGDGGLDCVIPRQGVVYQVYGPDTSPTDAKIAKKMNEDLTKAFNTLGEVLQIWRFIINRRGNGLGKKTTSALTNLHAQYPRIAMSVWSLDQLWDELMNPTEQHQARLVKLAKILGLKDFTPDFVAKADKLLDEAQDLAAKGKYQESYDKAKQAYAILKPHGLAEPLMRVLVCLIIWGSKLALGDSLRRYGEEIDILLPQVSNPKSHVNYYRTKVTLAHLARDLLAERAAAQKGMALLEQLDGDFAKIQYCCFCHSLISIACKEKDLDQATHWIAASTVMLDAYQGEHRDFLVLQLMDVRIWRAVLAKDEAELANCLTQLEDRGKQSEIGQQFAETLANYTGKFHYDKFFNAAKLAAQGALNLAHKLHLKQNFVHGVTYQLALAKCDCNDMEGAVATLKPLLTLPPSSENDMLKGAAKLLLASIEREAGRFEKSVSLAQEALAHIPDAREQIFIKFNLAKSFVGMGKLKDSVEHFQEAWHLAQDQENFPKDILIEFAGWCGAAAAQIDWSEKCNWALERLTALEQHDAKHCAQCREEIGHFSELRQRILTIGKSTGITLETLTKQVRSFALYSDLAPKKHSKVICNTLAQANALTISPLVTWWRDTVNRHHEAAIDLDYWGRGGFAQILSNMRAFPSAFNVILEVRSVHEIRAVAKLWGLYADTILLIWKGATETIKGLSTLDAEYFGPWGNGYILAGGSEVKVPSGRRRWLGIHTSSVLPADVITFMQIEAIDLIAAGKLLIVPASAAGCISPGWGPMEQGIAEAGNAIPGTRAKFDEVIGVGSLPFAPDLPFLAMLEFADKYERDLLAIRQNLATQAATYRNMGVEMTDQRLQRDIHDLLKMAEAAQKHDHISKKQRIEKEAIGFGTSPFRNGLRLDGDSGSASTFEPLLVLQTMGYGWQMGRLDAEGYQPPYQFAKGEAVAAWLCPAEAGMEFALVKKTDSK